MNKLLLIDGHSILNRAFYGLPDLTNAAGLHTNAVYGFLNILLKFLETEQPDGLAVAFDVHAPTFRHEMYAAYKGTRKPMPEELRQQVPMTKQMLAAMDVPVIEQPGYEADDILGTLAAKAERDGADVIIVSGDRDLLQLATEHTRICIPKTKAGGTTIEQYYAADVQAAYDVTPAEFIDVKALWGDTSDNIPGVPGIGEKTAKAIIAQYHSVENAYAHAAEVKPPRASANLQEYYDQAILSKTLATICTTAPVSLDPEAAALKNLFTPAAYALCREWDFKNLLTRFDEMQAAPGQEEALESSFEAVFDRAAADAFVDALCRSDAADIGVSMVLSGHSAAETGTPVYLALSNQDQSRYIPCAADEEQIKAWLLQLSRAGKRLCFAELKPHLGLLAPDAVRTEGPADVRVFDLSVAAYLLWPLAGEYPTADIAKNALGRTIPTWPDLFGKQKPKDVWTLPVRNEQMLLPIPGLAPETEEAASAADAAQNDPLFEKKLRYACWEAWVCAAAPAALEERLDKEGMRALYRDVELPLVATLYGMEQEGIAIDTAELSAYGEALSGRIEALEQEIYDDAGETFNIQSPKQLGVILFEKMGLPGGKKTKTGYSTAADVLEQLAPFAPVVAKILEYRQLTKLKSTYADGLRSCVAADGRIHTTFMQTVTATGRLSSTEPNLQNIPIRMELGKQIRRVFHAKPGYVFVDADYSQIELRVLAHMSGDENLIEAYRENRDIHRSTAARVFHVPFDEVTELQRRNAKAVNFGIVYGISAFGLSQDLSISRSEAQAYIDEYFAAYPGLHAFLNGLVESAKEKGYAETLYGRRRPVPELKNSNFMQRQFGERVAMNMPIQGTAADIIKIAMNAVDARIRRECARSRLLLQVHDELLVEAAEEEAALVAEILREEMGSAAKLLVPLEIDVHSGENWYDAK